MTIPYLVDIVVAGVAEMNESNTGEWVWCVGGDKVYNCDLM